MTHPKLSVVVCTYNRSRLLKMCLDSLTRQTLSPDKFEVIVVDNNSTDNTPEVVGWFLEEYSNIRLVREPLQGHAHARNRGWKEAVGTYVAYIDDDCVADDKWCAKILEAFDKASGGAVAVGGKIMPRYESAPPAWFKDEIETRTWGDEQKLLDGPMAQYGFSGANMSFQRHVLEECGGFSTGFGIVKGKLRMGEDTEIFTRIYRRYPRFWYDPEIIVLHYTPAAYMKISYRFLRGIRSGKGIAHIQDMRLLDRGHLRSIVGLAKLLLAGLPRMLFQSKGLLRTRLAVFMGQFGFLLANVCYPFTKLIR